MKRVLGVAALFIALALLPMAAVGEDSIALNDHQKDVLNKVNAYFTAIHTLTGSSSLESREAFEARLIALSRTHDLLARTSWEGASLREMLQQELDPVQATGGGLS